MSSFRETHRTFVPGKGNSFSSSSRQSTLDRFFTGAISNSNGLQREIEENCGNVFCSNGNNSYSDKGKGEDEVRDAEGSVSFVKIDLEAAKTWVYPGNFILDFPKISAPLFFFFPSSFLAMPVSCSFFLSLFSSYIFGVISACFLLKILD